MDHWAGIQPKANNQNKTPTQKPTPGRSKQVSSNLTKNMSDNAINEEVARAVQKLIALNKADQATADEEMTELSVNDDSVDQLVTHEYTDHCNPEGEGVQTPENCVSVDSFGKSKKGKKSLIHKRLNKRSNLEKELYEAENQANECNAYSFTPKRAKPSTGNEPGNETMSEESLVDIPKNISKYLKIDAAAGNILSAFYTINADEKLKEFTPMYVNIGDRYKAKELIGIRQNTKFVSTNAKYKNKAEEDQVNYLVVSFENRKKSNSPFVEFPLCRLGPMISALQELKKKALESGHYKEQRVFSSTYPDNTKIQPKDDKSTNLEITA